MEKLEYNLTDADIKEREDALDLAVNKLNSYGLKWTFRSINYVLNDLGLTFNNLRSCIFKDKNGEAVFNVSLAVLVLVESGLVGSKQVDMNNKSALESRAYDIIEDWLDEMYSLAVLHILIIDILEKKHFFTDMDSLKIIELLGYKNSQRDLAGAHILNNAQERLAQAQALS